jgi:hypothetical protein
MYEFFLENRIFHHSEPPIIGKNKDDNTPMYAEEGSNVIHNGEHLNPSLLQFHVTGAERAQKYFQLYHLDSNNTVGRSEDDVDLSTIAVLGGDLTTLRADEIDRKVSLDFNRLNDLMTKPRLIDEIKDTWFTLSFEYDQDDEPEPKKLTSMKKHELVNILIALREKAKTHIKETTKHEFDEAHQPELSLEEILSLDMYKLSANVLARDEYTVPPVVNCNL